MIMWEGPPSDLCWPIPASTDMAMASAAARELRPLGTPEWELCWITGAGEPVGSEVSFMLSSAAADTRGGHYIKYTKRYDIKDPNRNKP